MSCISKINSIFIDATEYPDLAMPIYNLLEHNGNYSMTSGPLWDYYADEMNDAANETNADEYTTDNKTVTSESLKCQIKTMEILSVDKNVLHRENVIPLKYLSNFSTSLDFPLDNCKIELDLLWLKHCIVSKILKTDAMAVNPLHPPDQTRTYHRNIKV